jgi:hypothetical protein
VLGGNAVTKHIFIRSLPRLAYDFDELARKDVGEGLEENWFGRNLTRKDFLSCRNQYSALSTQRFGPETVDGCRLPMAFTTSENVFAAERVGTTQSFPVILLI